MDYPIFSFFSSEGLSVVTLLFCYSAIAWCVYTHGRLGLFAFSFLALIVSDFQVLCAAPFASYGGPLVLGTVVYSSMFLINDLIVELYGLDAAKQNITLTLAGHIGLIAFLWLTLQYPSLPEASEYISYTQSKAAIAQIFHPQLGIFLASQCAYFISQWSDIHIFSHIRAKLPGALALRSWISVFLGIVIDTLLFNFLAWELFTDTPVPLNVLWTDYIFANTVIQFIILFLNIPVFYGILWLTRPSVDPLWRRLSLRVYGLWAPSRPRREDPHAPWSY